MAVWLDRAGGHGENEDFALENGVAIIGWDDLPDLGQTKSKEDIYGLLEENFPEYEKNTLKNWLSQIYAFRHRWEKGDLVVLPLKLRSAIAIGRVTGPYKYMPKNPAHAKHTVPVEWIETDIPRTKFEQDLLYSFGAFMTVCQISRNNAEERIKAVLEGKNLPSSKPVAVNDDDELEENEVGFKEDIDLELYAKDQIQETLNRKFRGHELARLVNEILKCQGYKTQFSPAGPDGGVDIIAGRGPLGFDHPKMCVQVKSSPSPVDVTVLRELQGILKNFGATQGLLVSWGGFKTSVANEAKRLFFEIRLWDAGDLVQALFENYEKLPADIQAELPLKRVWMLVPEDE